ncbi:hypothetical protein AB0I10_05550 [Streptomyces sp. NPDC050636]|uniref:hypothetical protein n=1 Tax=Streptomyces sp. NPDC050636 TaxID=3154510 RepID=UPI00341F1D34
MPLKRKWKATAAASVAVFGLAVAGAGSAQADVSASEQAPSQQIQVHKQVRADGGVILNYTKGDSWVGQVAWSPSGDKVRVRDTTFDGWGFQAYVWGVGDGNVSVCKTKGASGNGTWCDFNFREGHQVGIEGILVKGKDVESVGTRYVDN